MANTIPCTENSFLAEQAELLLSSFYYMTGQNLIAPELTDENKYRALFEASFCVVSHGIEADPIFNYGNNTALALFELGWKDFTSLASRHSAEPKIRQERQKLLMQVSKHGFIDSYRGVRVSSTGRRFLVENAVVWNLMDKSGAYCGQAAVLYEWTEL